MKWNHNIEIDARGIAPDVVARQLAEKIRALPEDFRALEDGTTTLDDIEDWLTGAADKVATCGPDAVNEVLGELYDWGNANRLWVHILT